MTLAAVPQRYQTLYQLNPMAQLVTAYRGILIEGRAPDWWSLLVYCSCRRTPVHRARDLQAHQLSVRRGGVNA